MKSSLLSIIISIFIFSAYPVSAQDYPDPIRPRVSIGPDIGFPSGSYGNLFSIGLGGSAKIEAPITKHLYAAVSAGYTEFISKNRINGEKVVRSNRSYIPLKAGAKYYFGQSVYVEGQLGVSVGAQKYAGTSFAWSPGLGLILSLSEKHAIDISIRSEKWEREGGDINQGGLRIAYQF